MAERMDKTLQTVSFKVRSLTILRVGLSVGQNMTIEVNFIKRM